MASKKESAVASEPEVRSDPASGSEVAAEAAASEPLAAPHALAAVPARYIALRHLIRNGKEYLPGDEVDMSPGPFEEVSPRQLAAHLAELVASGAIRKAG